MKESRVVIDSYYSYDTVSAMLFDSITDNVNKVYHSQKYKELTNLESDGQEETDRYLELYTEIQNMLDDYMTKQVLVLDISKLGFNHKTKEYIQNILTNFKNDDNMVDLSLLVLDEKAYINDKLPSIMKDEELADFVWFIDDIQNQSLTKNGKVYLREFHDQSDHDIDQVLKANKFVKQVANQIKQMDLTPFESALYIHEFCSQFYYNMEEGEYDIFGNKTNEKYGSRTLSSILESGHICCIGYSTMYKAICDELNMPGLECKLNACIAKDEYGFNLGHGNNRVIITDLVYDIDGVYIDDITLNAVDERLGIDFSSCLFSVSDIQYTTTEYKYSDSCMLYDYYEGKLSDEKIKKSPKSYTKVFKKKKLQDEHGKFLRKNSNSKPIELEKYVQGLINLRVKKGDDLELAKEYAVAMIKNSYYHSLRLFKSSANNCFLKQAQKQNLSTDDKRHFSYYANLKNQEIINNILNENSSIYNS